MGLVILAPVQPVEGVEECDGSDFGGATCISEGFDGGNLSCNFDCTLNVSQCFADPTPPSVPGSPSQLIAPTMDIDISQPETPGLTITERVEESLNKIIEDIIDIFRRTEDLEREGRVVEERPIRGPGSVEDDEGDEDPESDLSAIEEVGIEDEDMEEIQESFISNAIKNIKEEIQERGVVSWPVVSFLLIILIIIMTIYIRF